jgi:hypothetical protein
MAGMNEDAQWIVMLGFIISILLVFLALIVNQSAMVGKTTSESVLEFPKSDIQDARAEILGYNRTGALNDANLAGTYGDIQMLALERRGVIINYSVPDSQIFIHYNDGLTEYNEIYFMGIGS